MSHDRGCFVQVVLKVGLGFRVLAAAAPYRPSEAVCFVADGGVEGRLRVLSAELLYQEAVCCVCADR